MLVGSLRWAFFLILLVVLLGQLSEGKGGRSGGGRGGGRSGGSRSRGSSSARSSSRSSSSSGKSSWFGSSKGHSSSGSSWFTSVKSPSSRTGGGFKGSGSHSWSSSNPRPSVTSTAVSHGLFAPSRSSVYYGSSSGCGFGGCGNSYAVYHYYPRSHYYGSRQAATTPSPIGPTADRVSATLTSNDTLIYGDGIEASNGTEVAEIADPTRPLIIQDLAFFWDNKYLPSKDTQGCATYTPVNSNSTISYCDVKEYSRCQRNLKELSAFKDIFFPDGTAPSHLAWLCPAGTGCCDWECCYDGEGYSVGHYFWWCIIGGILFYVVVRCCWSCGKVAIEEEKEHRRKAEERQKLYGGQQA